LLAKKHPHKKTKHPTFEGNEVEKQHQ